MFALSFSENKNVELLWRTVFLCLSLVFIGHTPFSQGQISYAGIPFIETFNPQDYQGGIQNWQIAQDPRGLLYVANNLGLLEYDGSEWKRYTVPNGSKLRSVMLDSNGKVYVAAQNEIGYFFPNAIGQLTYHSLMEKIPVQYRNFEESWGIFKRLDGSIYFTTFKYIFRLKDGSFQIIDPKKDLEFSFLLNQELYVSVIGEGLQKLSGNKLIEIPQGRFFADKRISHILPFSDTKLLITTFQEGAFLYDGYRTEEFHIVLNGSSIKQINKALRMESGDWLIGTQTDGLLRIADDGTVIRQLSRSLGLNSRTVLSLYQDARKNVWAGLNNGLAYIEWGSPFTKINEATGLLGTGYTACLTDESLFLGTNNGVHRQVNQGEVRQYEPLEGSSGIQAYHLTNAGELLIGAHQGAFVWRNGRLIRLSEGVGVWNFTTLPSDPTSLLSGTYNGFMRYDQERNGWGKAKNLKGFAESSRVVALDKGSIWMTHGYKGVYRLALNLEDRAIKQVGYYGTKEGFPSKEFINVFRVKNELIYTSEKGIYQFNAEQDRFRPSSYYNAIFGDSTHIRYLEEAPNGDLYFIDKNYQVGNVSFDQFETPNITKGIFNKLDKLLNDDLEYIKALDFNNVLFAAKEGFIHYDPLKPHQLGDPFSVLLRKVESIGETHRPLFAGSFIENGKTRPKQPKTAIPILNDGENSLRFTYSVNFFEDRERILFQYQLEGFSPDWSEWSSKNVREYTNLPSGNYTFKVRAKNVYGVISSEESYSFTVFPAWYVSTWAFALYAALLVTGYIATLRFTKKKHDAEKRILTIEKERELSAKDQQLSAVSQESQKTINQLKNEKLQAEIEHKNKELATATMLMVNKNTFIGSLKHTLSTIIQKDEPNSATTKDLNKVIKTIDKNLAQSNDWEQFQHHFDKVHGNFSIRLCDQFPSLTPQERKLSAYLRMNMSTKEIASLMNISVRGVEISRYRLRKKLNLEKGDNLVEFILNF